MHTESYTNLYEDKANYDAILNALIPRLTGLDPFDKWILFPNMGYLITSVYDMTCIDLTRYGFSETFFPLRSKSTQNPSELPSCVLVGYQKHNILLKFI